MCEYSLEAAKTEQARQGETYKMGRVGGHTAFVTDASCETAACMPEGTRLRIEGISPGVQSKFGIPATIEGVMVRESVNAIWSGAGMGVVFYDAVRLENDRVMRLAYLGHDFLGRWTHYDGCQATVLMLGAVKAPEDVDLAGPPPPQYTGTPERVGIRLSLVDVIRSFERA